jgi:hypothetical protein
MLADNGVNDITSKIATDAIRNGLLCQFDAASPNVGGAYSPGKAKLVAQLLVDAVAILATGGASAATAQTITSFNGVGVGGGGAKMSPARRVTMALSNNANWSSSTAILSGYDAHGAPIRELLVIPASGNVTLTSKAFFQYVTELYIPAQGGAAGTYTLGVTADDGVFTRRDSGILIYNPAHEPYDSNDAVTAGDVCAVLLKGRIWVPCEGTVAEGDSVFVRAATVSTDIRGQFRSGAAANFSPLSGAVWRSSNVSSLAILELL